MAKISSEIFDTVTNVDSQVSAVLGNWPDDSGFDARTALEQNPHLSEHSRAVTAFALEEFAILLENGKHPPVREFSARFPEVQSDLESRLFHLLSLEASGHLLTDGPADSEWPRPGKTIGNFKLVEQLGIGAFSRVFLAYDTMMGNRSVVVKVTRRPADECRLAGPLDHPNIARMFSVSVDSDTGFTIVCMGYCGRLTCDDLREINPFIKQAREFPESNPIEFIETALSIVCSVGAGVGHLHENGILHRDIKPSNIVLSNEMYPTLVDFNASSVFANSSGIVVGTLPYVAPEILDGIKSGGLPPNVVAPSADIYALGLVCYEMLAGVLPFDITRFAEDDGVTVDSIRRAQLCDWTPLRERNPLISKRLEEIISRATAPSADHRFTNVQEFCRGVRSELGPLKKLARRLRSHSRVAIAGGSVVGILAATTLASSIGPGPIEPSVKSNHQLVEPSSVITDVLDDEILPNTSITESASGIETPSNQYVDTALGNELLAFDLLADTIATKNRQAIKHNLAKADRIFTATQKEHKLSVESLNNWGYALTRSFDSEKTASAAPLLLEACRISPGNKVFVSNQVKCELISCVTQPNYSPNVGPFISYLATNQSKPDSQLLAVGAYCLLRAAKATDEKNAELQNKLITKARDTALRGLELGSTNPAITSLLESIHMADPTTIFDIDVKISEFARAGLERHADDIVAPSNH